jgi:hypothetical protein
MTSLIPSGSSSGTGSMTLLAPNTNSNQTVTIPDATGTVMVSGNMPAFSAYGNAAQTVTTSTFTKVTLNTKEFDTNNNFDSTTNYRFTPTVAGYYQINGQIYFSTSVSTTRILIGIYKNGSAYKWGNDFQTTTAISAFRGVVSSIVYLNGSTDYVELYGYIVGSGTLAFGGTSTTDDYFNGSLVRSA